MDEFTVSNQVTGIHFVFFKKGDESIYLKNPVGRIVKEFQATKDSYQIDGEEVIVYRYKGPYYCSTTENGEVIGENQNNKSVSILLYSDFGFLACFWGLPEHEDSFWATIDSIKFNQGIFH